MSAPVHPEIQSLFDEVVRCHGHLTGLLAFEDDVLGKHAPAVSGWSVVQQMVHVALANTRMLTAVHRIVARKAPAQSRGWPSLAGRYVLLRGDFPRGRGKAPPGSVPPENVSRKELDRVLDKSRTVLDSTAPLLPVATDATWRVRHHVFGLLNARQWLRLIAIHADHHFAIIDDILAAPEDAD